MSYDAGLVCVYKYLDELESLTSNICIASCSVCSVSLLMRLLDPPSLAYPGRLATQTTFVALAHSGTLLASTLLNFKQLDVDLKPTSSMHAACVAQGITFQFFTIALLFHWVFVTILTDQVVVQRKPIRELRAQERCFHLACWPLCCLFTAGPMLTSGGLDAYGPNSGIAACYIQNLRDQDVWFGAPMALAVAVVVALGTRIILRLVSLARSDDRYVAGSTSAVANAVAREAVLEKWCRVLAVCVTCGDDQYDDEEDEEDEDEGGDGGGDSGVGAGGGEEGGNQGHDADNDYLRFPSDDDDDDDDEEEGQGGSGRGSTSEDESRRVGRTVTAAAAEVPADDALRPSSPTDDEGGGGMAPRRSGGGLEEEEKGEVTPLPSLATPLLNQTNNGGGDTDDRHLSSSSSSSGSGRRTDQRTVQSKTRSGALRVGDELAVNVVTSVASAASASSRRQQKQRRPRSSTKQARPPKGARRRSNKLGTAMRYHMMRHLLFMVFFTFTFVSILCDLVNRSLSTHHSGSSSASNPSDGGGQDNKALHARFPSSHPCCSTFVAVATVSSVGLSVGVIFLRRPHPRCRTTTPRA